MALVCIFEGSDKGGDAEEMTDEKFKDLVIQYEKLVFTVCYQLVHDYHESQNLTQETFLAAYRHIDTYQGENYKPWLIRIASNKAKDYLKSAYARRVQLDYDSVGEQMIDMRAGLDDAYIQKETSAAILQAIESLKEPYQKAVSMYFLEEKSTEEIAEILGRPVKTVQTQIYRGKFLLREMLKETVGKERSS